MNNYINYENQVCVVLGGVLGMGLSTVNKLVDLGAKVYVLDIEPIDRSDVTYIQVDIRDTASIDAAFAQLPQIDKFFGYAAVSGLNKSLKTVMVTNFLSYKHIMDNILLEKMNEGGAVAITTSSMGANWAPWIEEYEWLLSASREDSIKFFDMNEGSIGNTYAYGKRALNAYCYIKSFEYYHAKKVRINTIWPGYTDTRLMYEFAWGRGNNNDERLDYIKQFCVVPGRPSTADEVADSALYVNSDMASYVVCDTIQVDGGLSNMNAILRFVPDEHKTPYIRNLERLLSSVQIAADNLPLASKPLIYPQ